MSIKVGNGLNLQGQKIINLADASAATDAVNLETMQAYLNGITWKNAVIAAATASVTVSNPGTAVFDGVTLTSGQRLLLKSQGTNTQNGIYVFNGSSSALTLATDASTAAEYNGAAVFVEQGSTLGGTAWTQTAIVVTLGTSPITWTQFGAGLSYTADEVGIHLSAGQFSIKSTWAGQTAITTLGTVTSGTWNATTIAVANGGTGATGASGARTNLGAVGKYAATITTVGGTPLNVNHNLGTLDITVTLWDSATTGNLVFTDIVIVDSNNLTVTTASAATAYRIVVTG